MVGPGFCLAVRLVRLPSGSMPANELPLALWFLLGAMAGGLLLLLLGQWSQGARLRRIESRLAAEQSNSGALPLAEQKAETKEQKRLFNEYLDEDPGRRELPKKEQFAGFRKWRSEKGLNWKSGS